MEPAGLAAVRVQQVRPQTSGEPRFEIRIDRVLDYRLYGHDEPGVDVHGNLIDAKSARLLASKGGFMIANLVTYFVMKERAAQANCKFKITSTVGKGTKIVVSAARKGSL